MDIYMPRRAETLPRKWEEFKIDLGTKGVDDGGLLLTAPGP